MPTDLGMSSTLNSDYMPYMKEPSLHLSDEPSLLMYRRLSVLCLYTLFNVLKYSYIQRKCRNV